MLSHAEPRAVPNPGGLGRRIATLRHANGWSQRRLAEAAGVSHGYIALLELGRLPSPGKFRLDAVAHALNLRTSDALTGPVLLPPEPPPTPRGGGVPHANVVGGLDQLRTAGARPLPVFR